MIRMFLLLISSLLLITGCSTTISDRTPSGEALDIISAEFGLTSCPIDGKPTFISTNAVPYLPNQSYGWIIKLRTTAARIRWREEFTLPIKPSSWGEPPSDGSRVITNDGRTSITDREVLVDGGLISNSWSIVPGDPKGHHIIRVFIEDHLVGNFEFEVQ